VKLRTSLTNAMKEKDVVMKDTLRMILGEIPRLNLKANEHPTDIQMLSIIEKLMKSEIELLTAKGEDPSTSEYVNILDGLLPEKVSEEDVIKFIKDNIDFGALKNKMQAVGMVTKHFGKAVDGQVVSKIIQGMRNNP
jgi:uncharacterized protein YqeY